MYIIYTLFGLTFRSLNLSMHVLDSTFDYKNVQNNSRLSIMLLLAKGFKTGCEPMSHDIDW